MQRPHKWKGLRFQARDVRQSAFYLFEGLCHFWLLFCPFTLTAGNDNLNSIEFAKKLSTLVAATF